MNTIKGRCVQVGNDDNGMSRLVIHVTREDLTAFERNLVFADVAVTLSRDAEMGGPDPWAPFGIVVHFLRNIADARPDHPAQPSIEAKTAAAEAVHSIERLIKELEPK